jgi:hypothetical protein
MAGTPSVAADAAKVAAAAPPLPVVPAGASGDACPDCGTPRASATAIFCEVCRYNFQTRTSWSPAGSVSAVPVSTPAPAPVAPVAPAEAAPPIPVPEAAPVPLAAPVVAVPQRFEAVVVVDPSLYTDPDPSLPCPDNEPVRHFPIDFDENLIGRRSDSRDIHPEIALSDPGVSHRHAKILREVDGGFVLLDVGSTNGTNLNGAPLQTAVKMPLHDGDQITLGCWTCITFQAAGR